MLGIQTYGLTMKYKLTRFYRRSHEMEFESKEAALAHVKATALRSDAQCYTELWQMKNDTDGEQLAFFDCDGNEVLATSGVNRARIVHHFP